MEKPGRNEPCHCGSGKKYKKCCLAKDEESSFSEIKEQREFDNYDEREHKDADFEIDSREEDEEYEAEEVEPDAESDDEDDYEKDEKLIIEPANRIKEEYPDISVEEEKLVDAWWDKYRKIEDPILEKKHLMQFMEDHPKLVVNLRLHFEVLFELGASYLNLGKYEEHINFLLEIRRKFADAYLKSGGYYDRDIIIYLLATGRENEISKYTDILMEYPVDFVDQVFEVKDLLLATDNFDVLLPLLNKTYKPIWYSADIMYPYDILDPLITCDFDTYVEKDKKQFNAKGFIDNLKNTVEIELDEEVYTEKYWQDIFESQSRPYTPWPDAVPKKMSQLIQLYKNIKDNYTWFIKEKTGISYPSAEYFALELLEYLSSFMDDNRRPKKLFNFSIKALDKTLYEICRDFLHIDFTKFISALHAIFYFADYLYACGNIDETERNEIKENVTEIFDDTYLEMKKDYAAGLIFSKFPYF